MIDSQTISAHNRRAHAPGHWMWSLAAALIALAGIGLQWFGLGKLSLDFDEGYTAWLAHQPAAEIIRLVQSDTAPPLYYLTLHFWMRIFGGDEWGLRSLSAASVSASFVFVWILARQILRKPWAVAGALAIFSVSHMQVIYAQDARAYALASLFAIASLFGVFQHLRSRGWGWLPWIVAALAGQVYVHNMMLAYLPALGLAWLMFPSSHSVMRRIRDGGIVLSALVIIYLPWAFIISQQVQLVHAGFWVPVPTVDWIIMVFGLLAGIDCVWAYGAILEKLHVHVSQSFFTANVPRVAVTLLCALIVLAVLLPARRKRREAGALAVYALFPPIIVAIYSCLGTPIFMDKTFLASASVFPILMLIPAAWARPRNGRPICLVLAGCLFMMSSLTTVAYQATRYKENWRGAGQYLAQLPPTRRIILCVSEDGQLPLDFYYHHRWNETETGAPAGFFDLNPPRAMRHIERYDDALLPLASAMKYPEIVLVEGKEGIADPNQLVLKLLSWSCTKVSTRKLAYVTIYRFIPQTR